MAGKLTSSQLIRFSADAGDGGDDDSAPTVNVTLVTELKGVVSRTLAGCRTCATLLVEFARAALCDRMVLIGIAPPGHAPLDLPSARYVGSTCPYARLDEDLWWVYSDDAAAQSTLVIDCPQGNLFDYFSWPAPLVEFNPPVAPGETQPQDWRAELLALINAMRAEVGAGPLQYCWTLGKAAQTHIAWCVEQGDVSHEGAGGSNPTERALAAGYSSPVGEVLVINCSTLAQAVEAWRHSPGHYAILTDPNGAVLGLGRAAQTDYPDLSMYAGEVGYVVEDVATFPYLRLQEFRSLFPPNGPGETDRGVQMPARLVAIRDGTETALRTLNYEDAPRYSGSEGSVTCQDTPAWSLSAQELRAALTTPGLYEIWWRIYKGSGDMVYAVDCDEQHLSTYTDRRNAGIGGGFGDVLTTDLRAAQVLVCPRPLPFLAHVVAPGGWSVCLEDVLTLTSTGTWAVQTGRDAVAYARDGVGPVDGLFRTYSPGAYQSVRGLWRDAREWHDTSTRQHEGWYWLTGQDLTPQNAAAGAPYLSIPDSTWTSWAAQSSGTKTSLLRLRRTADGAPIQADASGATAVPLWLMEAGRRAWVGGDDALTWDGPYLYLGGRELWAVPTRVLCACLVPSGAGRAVRYLTDGGHGLYSAAPLLAPWGGALWQRDLVAGSEAVLLASAPLPHLVFTRPGYPSTPAVLPTRYLWAELDSYQMDADGTHILAYRRQRNAYGDLAPYPYALPGAVWEATLDIGAGSLAWVQVHTADMRAAYTWALDGSTLTGTSRTLLGAWYRGGARVIREVELRAQTAGSDWGDAVRVLEDGAERLDAPGLIYQQVRHYPPQPNTRLMFPRAEGGALHVLRLVDTGYALTYVGAPEVYAGYYADRAITLSVDGQELGAWTATPPDVALGTLPGGPSLWYPGETLPAINQWAQTRAHVLRVLTELALNDGRGVDAMEGPDAWAAHVPEYRYSAASLGEATLCALVFGDQHYTAASWGTPPAALTDQTVTQVALVTPAACLEALHPTLPQTPPRRRISEAARAVLAACNTHRAVANLPPLVWSPELCVAAAWMQAGQPAQTGPAGFPVTLQVMGRSVSVSAGPRAEVSALLAEAMALETLIPGAIYLGAWMQRHTDADDVVLSEDWYIVIGGQID